MLATRWNSGKKDVVSKNRGKLSVSVFLVVGTLLLSSCSNTGPTAVFTASHISGLVPFTVTFDASLCLDGDGQISTYQWDFGDGQDGSGERVMHTYEDPGTYTVKLTIVDNRGMSDSSTLAISAEGPAPCRVGDSVGNGDIQMTLRSVQLANEIGQWQPEAGQRFLVADLRVVALTDGQRVANWHFTVLHGDGSHKAEQDPATFSLDSYFNCPKLDTGEWSEGEIAFEVYPADFYLLEYDDQVHEPIRFQFSP